MILSFAPWDDVRVFKLNGHSVNSATVAALEEHLTFNVNRYFRTTNHDDPQGQRAL